VNTSGKIEEKKKTNWPEIEGPTTGRKTLKRNLSTSLGVTEEKEVMV